MGLSEADLIESDWVSVAGVSVKALQGKTNRLGPGFQQQPRAMIIFALLHVSGAKIDFNAEEWN